MEVLSKRYGGTNDTTEVEDSPINCNELALLVFSGVRQHKGTLGRPEQTGANAEDGTGGNDKCTCIAMNVYSPDSELESAMCRVSLENLQVGADVERITCTTKK